MRRSDSRAMAVVDGQVGSRTRLGVEKQCGRGCVLKHLGEGSD